MPSATGLKLTAMVQVAFGARLAPPQVSLILANCAVLIVAVRAEVADMPPFLTVKTVAALVPPTLVRSKAAMGGSIVSELAAPVRLAVAVAPIAPADTVRVAIRRVEAVGLKATWTVHVPPPGSAATQPSLVTMKSPLSVPPRA